MIGPCIALIEPSTVDHAGPPVVLDIRKETVEAEHNLLVGTRCLDIREEVLAVHQVAQACNPNLSLSYFLSKIWPACLGT